MELRCRSRCSGERTLANNPKQRRVIDLGANPPCGTMRRTIGAADGCSSTRVKTTAAVGARSTTAAIAPSNAAIKKGNRKRKEAEGRGVNAAPLFNARATASSKRTAPALRHHPISLLLPHLACQLCHGSLQLSDFDRIGVHGRSILHVWPWLCQAGVRRAHDSRWQSPYKRTHSCSR